MSVVVQYYDRHRKTIEERSLFNHITAWEDYRKGQKLEAISRSEALRGLSEAEARSDRALQPYEFSKVNKEVK